MDFSQTVIGFIFRAVLACPAARDGSRRVRSDTTGRDRRCNNKPRRQAMKFKSLALAAALLAALAGPAAAQVKERVFKVGIGLSEDHPQALAVKRFGELLAQKSGG